MPDYDVTTWYALFAPHGTPKPVIAKLNSTLSDILKEPAIRERLTAVGVVVKSSTPEAFDQFMAEEYAKWSKVRVAGGPRTEVSRSYSGLSPAICAASLEFS